MQNLWNTALFKSNAKANFSQSYWPFVGVSVLLTLLSGNLATFRIQYYVEDFHPWADPYYSLAAIPALWIFSLALPAIPVIHLLVTNPYEVGACRFFLDNNGEQRAPFSTVGMGFQRNYGNVVLTQFLRYLFIFLWSLLFLIPGIIRAYAYFAVPYILAENPDLDHKRVLQLSMEMTYGHKVDIFCTQLSFFFWALLSAITMNIVGIFYVEPYYQATKAEMYRYLRFEALQRGIVSPGELPGSNPDTHWRSI